jgi:hypothetical protein
MTHSPVAPAVLDVNRNRSKTAVATEMSWQSNPGDSWLLFRPRQSTGCAFPAIGLIRFCTYAAGSLTAAARSIGNKHFSAASATFGPASCRDASANFSKFPSRLIFSGERTPYSFSNALGSFSNSSSARYGRVLTRVSPTFPSSSFGEHGISKGRYLSGVTVVTVWHQTSLA